MFSQEDKLIKAVLDDDVAGARKLLRTPGVHSKVDYVFMRFHLGSPRQSSLLHLAAYSNSSKVARFLIDNGEGVNLANDVGDTPLHVAARYNAWETADLLISCGAKIHLPNNADQTPQDIAISNGNFSLAELLRLASKQPAAK